MMMPVMDGPATIRALRNMRADVRIIAASGLHGRGNDPHAEAIASVRHFLPKPYTAESLLTALTRAAVGAGDEPDRRAAGGRTRGADCGCGGGGRARPTPRAGRAGTYSLGALSRFTTPSLDGANVATIASRGREPVRRASSSDLGAGPHADGTGDALPGSRGVMEAVTPRRGRRRPGVGVGPGDRGEPDSPDVAEPRPRGVRSSGMVSHLVHEFAHCVSLQVNPRIANNPRWLWESVAIYESRQSVDLRIRRPT